MLQEVIAEYDAPLAKASSILREELELRPSSRLKTKGTTLEKLRRERNRLSTIQDIAGLRIVVDCSLSEQDELADRITRVFGECKIDDRRQRPSHGYRAIHVIASVEGFSVEIQVRTTFQDLWAQSYERLADRLGRGIRYGELPKDPEAQKIVSTFQSLSKDLAAVEEMLDPLVIPDLPEPPPADAPPGIQESYAQAVEMNRKIQEEVARVEKAKAGAVSGFQRLLDHLRPKKEHR